MTIRSFFKAFYLSVVIAMFANETALAEAATAQHVFAKPLITGASVSADWNTKSPGKTLSLRYSDQASIRTVAVGGRPGKDMIQQIKESDLDGRSIILAIDFLFWDSTHSDAQSSRKALQKLVDSARKRRIPIVLGEIPELLPGRQHLRPLLNEYLSATCSTYEACYLMPLDHLHRQILRDGFLDINGKKFTIQQLLPDGLHLSPPASEYLADMMLGILSRKGAVKANG